MKREDQENHGNNRQSKTNTRHDICMASDLCEYHAKRLAGHLGWDYVGKASNDVLEKYERILFLGVTDWVVEKCIQVKEPKKILQWAGTDVMTSVHKRLPKGKIFYIAQCERLKEDLKKMRFPFKVWAVISTVAENYKIEPLPQNFSILSYLPDLRNEFFQTNLVLAVAERMPDVKFKIFGRRKTLIDTKLPNVKNYGWINGEKKYEIYLNSSCLLRMPKHDAMSQVMVEMFQMGRRVIHNYPYLYAHQCHSVIDIINIIKQDIMGYKEPDYRASEYYCREYSFENIKKKYEQLLKEIG